VEDQEKLQQAWLEWTRTNLGQDPARVEVAATAAREAIGAGKGINAAYEAARLAYGPVRSAADETVVADRASTLSERLTAWQAAGIIDGATATKIQDFEAARPLAERSGGITVSEVVAYIGTVVLLVGVGFLYGTQYSNLGTAGRLVILGLVVAAGLAAGELVRRLGATAASRRARAAGWTVAAMAAGGWFTQAFIDGNLLTQSSQYGGSPDTSGALMAGAAIGAAFALFLLWRAGAGLIAVAAAALTYLAAGALDAYMRIPEPTDSTELTWLVPGAVLAILAETVARPHERRWAREILRFASVVPPTIAALVFSNAGSTGDLEWFAGILAVGAFGLSLWRGSAGYAIAGGVALFIVVNEVGFRHFASSLGFPVVLIVSGITLFAVAAGLVRLLPRLRRSA
jgi:hypothetical protein